MNIEFFAPGDPMPQGSKRAFYVAKLGRAVMTESCAKLKPWRAVVSLAAQNAMQGKAPVPDPVSVSVNFFFSRPKSHFGTGKNAHEVKVFAPKFKNSKPDVDKLLRGILDALTGIVFIDDSCVVVVTGRKEYSSGSPGAAITVKGMEGSNASQ